MRDRFNNTEITHPLNNTGDQGIANFGEFYIGCWILPVFNLIFNLKTDELCFTQTINVIFHSAVSLYRMFIHNIFSLIHFIGNAVFVRV